MADRELSFGDSPTVLRFLEDWGLEGQYLQGPFGSGKTLGGATKLVIHGQLLWDRPLPGLLQSHFGRPKGLESRYVVVRRYWEELRKTTLKTFLRWFEGAGTWKGDSKTFVMSGPNGVTSEILWMGLDDAGLAKILSLDVTGFMLDEACELSEDVWLGLQGRKRRFPDYPEKQRYSYLLADAPAIALSNPPDEEHWLVREFERTPHAAYRQYTQPSGLSPAAENLRNLENGYYERLLETYRARPDLQKRYVFGQRAVLVRGGPVYQHQFRRDEHVTTAELVWPGSTARILRGWDASGNVPACVVSWITPSGRWDLAREFVTDREGVSEFAGRVVEWCRVQFPGAEWVDVGDPATFAEFSKPGGGLTSNARIMRQEHGIELLKGVQKFEARRDALGSRLQRREGVLVSGPGCPRLVSGLEGGYAYPELPDGRGYGPEPVKNQYSHVVEAAQYASTWISGDAERQSAPPRQSVGALLAGLRR